MRTLRYALGTRRWMVLGGGMGVLVVMTLMVLAFNAGSDPASAASSGPEMVLNIKGGNCDDPIRPTKCDVPAGGSFTLSVDALGIPAGGYTLMQTAIELGTKLIYTQTALSTDEIAWPDVEPAIITRFMLGTVQFHGGLTGFIPPLPVSTYVGNVVEIALGCPLILDDSPLALALLPAGHPDAGTSGTLFKDAAGTDIVPKVSSLTINCLAPTPTPTDTPTPTNSPTPTPCLPEGCPATPTPSISEKELIPSTIFDGFSSVWLDGDTAIVGAMYDDTQGLDSGSAFIFERHFGGFQNWGEVKKLSASDPTPGWFFGNSVSVSGDTAVVGMWDTWGTSTGAAYVFQRDHGGVNNWGQVAKLVGSDSESEDHFGWGVAISGDTIVVGARYHDAAGSAAGAAYVFERNQGGPSYWGQVRKLVGADTAAGDFFGRKAGIDGDTIVIGAHGNDAVGSHTGAAYIFQRDHGGPENWGQVKKLLASDAEAKKNFAFGLAIKGELVIAGTSGPNTGSAYVFGRNQGGPDDWGEIKKLAETPDETFGDDVTIDASLAVVAASGGSRVFDASAGGADNWGEVGSVTRTGSVSIHGTTVLVAGGKTAWIIELVPVPYPTSTPTSTPIPAPGPDSDGDGCSDNREIGLDERLGGMRDWQNPHDFYDVLGPGAVLPKDGVIDLPNDVLGVIQHFSPDGASPYDVQFDRGPSSGPNPWNMTAPDGVIDLPNDILGVINQFNHSCQ